MRKVIFIVLMAIPLASFAQEKAVKSSTSKATTKALCKEMQGAIACHKAAPSNMKRIGCSWADIWLVTSLEKEFSTNKDLTTQIASPAESFAKNLIALFTMYDEEIREETIKQVTQNPELAKDEELKAMLDRKTEPLPEDPMELFRELSQISVNFFSEIRTALKCDYFQPILKDKRRYQQVFL